MRRSSPLSRSLQVVLAVLAVGLLVWLLRAVLSPVFFAFLLAYMLDPIVDRFEALGWPRALGIALILTAALGGIGLFCLLALPTIVRDIAALAEQLPMAFERLLSMAIPTLEGFGVPVPSNADELLERLGDMQLSTLVPTAMTPVKAVAQGLLGGTATFFGAMAAFVMVPIFAFYLLEDFDRMTARIHTLLPHDLRPRVTALVQEVDTVLGQFVRGQLMVMGILAVLYAGGYALAGVALAVPIGVVAGVFSFIPYVGGAAALGMALLMAVLHYQGPAQLIAVTAVYAVIQVLEGFVITPKIVGDKLGLAPVWVLFALMVGGELFGFLGVMLALPAAAVVKVFVSHGIDRYTRSALYLGRTGAAARRHQGAMVARDARDHRTLVRVRGRSRRRRRVRG